MADYIDRQAILKNIEKIRQGALMMDDMHRASIIMNGMHLCEEAVENQPSADIQDQIDNAYMHGYTAAEARYRDALRHGHWVASDEDGFVCSICRCGYKDQPTMMGKPIFDYCPVCGARMDGEKNG